MTRAALINGQDRAYATRLRRPRVATLATLIMVCGLLLRLATLATPHAYFPDEIFQYLEAAHRLAFGPGIVPWEYREHVRNWLMPLLLAGPMRLGEAIAPGSDAYLLLPKLVLLAVSMTTIPAAAMIGRRFSALHALFAMLVAAISAEFVYFSTIALTEPFAAFIFLAAAALLYWQSEPSKRDLLGAGALLMLVCLVRFQYGPAAMALGLAYSARKPSRAWWMSTGGLPILALSIAIDLAMGGLPFAWLFANIHQNITLGRSHAWVDGPFYYFQTLALVWGIWLVPLVALAVVGARRCPALLLAALVNLLAHTMIAHKEYRYILLTTMLLAILAALGTADAIRWTRRHSAPGRWKHLTLIAAGTWLAASATIAAAGPMRYWWSQRQSQLAAFASLREAPGLCGVAIFGIDWTETGGYAYLHRPVPMFGYALTGRRELLRDAAQYNAILAPVSVPAPAAFREERCFAGQDATATMCVRIRPGKCAELSSSAEINRQLIRAGR